MRGSLRGGSETDKEVLRGIPDFRIPTLVLVGRAEMSRTSRWRGCWQSKIEFQGLLCSSEAKVHRKQRSQGKHQKNHESRGTDLAEGERSRIRAQSRN